MLAVLKSGGKKISASSQKMLHKNGDFANTRSQFSLPTCGRIIQESSSESKSKSRKCEFKEPKIQHINVFNFQKIHYIGNK